MGKEEKMRLSDLQEQVRESIERRFIGKYWITAEISEIKNHYSGHCYLDLIDKNPGEDAVTAKAQAIIWANNYRMLRPFFETTTGSPLSKGMHILVYVQVQFSPLYGLSLVITDIDPAFTVGEQELLRQETINRLKAEGMFEMNSTLDFPPLPRRLAVISSEQAAGYRDFMKQLHENEFGFNFHTELFPAPMQGITAPEGIIEAMDEVAERGDEFDLLLILRGGGAAHDLACFDDYNLAANIAQFPIPVVVGVGHDHDFHIADMVAHTSVKTPTALADFIIELFAAEEQQILYLTRRLSMALQNRILTEKNRIQLLEQRVISGNPLKLLEKGYALIHKEGRRIRNINDISVDDKIGIILNGGQIECVVKEKSEEQEKS